MDKIKIKLGEKKDSKIEILGEIPVELIETEKEKSLKKLAENIEIKGFRKGNAPLDMVKNQVGDLKLIEETAKDLILDRYIETITENNLSPIGQPEISLTKVASGSPVEFKIVTFLMPEISLPDYKKIASGVKEEAPSQVKDEDVENVIKELQNMKAEQNAHAREHGNDEHDHSHPHSHDIKPEDIPELNDDFAKSVGNFESIDDLKKKIKENLEEEKKAAQKNERRMKILDEIREKSKVSLPEILIENEIDIMMFELDARIKGSGMKTEDYLKQINKTPEALREEMKESAKKRVELQMVFSEIAKEEKIKIDDAKIDKEVDALMGMYPGADKIRVRNYVEETSRNEEVIKILEGEAGGKE
ncbi:hypothetical protein KC842_01930 [Candidatus Nomurabacteria bacterium]|nr:hypothetical protein [Candidatus Nomurabacteria bacterium]USN94723.1 MAG: hypothetical protein H6791_03145 [Candidatus Nomurabacteria bacterium]